MGLKLIKGKGKAPKPLQIVAIKPVPVSKPKKKTRAKKYGPKIPKKVLEARRVASAKKSKKKVVQYGPTRKKKSDDSLIEVTFGKAKEIVTGKKKRGRPKGSLNKNRQCIITDRDLHNLDKWKIVRK